jgi:hypothetical protein
VRAKKFVQHRCRIAQARDPTLAAADRAASNQRYLVAGVCAEQSMRCVRNRRARSLVINAAAMTMPATLGRSFARAASPAG